MSKDHLYQGPIYVKKSPIHGYGVFAAQNLPKAMLIEKCPLVFFEDESELFYKYSFACQGKRALSFGYGSIYNHSDTPNVRFDYDPTENLLLFTTLRPIRAGEELLSYYGKDWFSSRNLRPLTLTLWHRVYFYSGRIIFRSGLLIFSYFVFLQGLHYLSS